MSFEDAFNEAMKRFKEYVPEDELGSVETLINTAKAQEAANAQLQQTNQELESLRSFKEQVESAQKEQAETEATKTIKELLPNATDEILAQLPGQTMVEKAASAKAVAALTGALPGQPPADPAQTRADQLNSHPALNDVYGAAGGSAPNAGPSTPNTAQRVAEGVASASPHAVAQAMVGQVRKCSQLGPNDLDAFDKQFGTRKVG